MRQFIRIVAVALAACAVPSFTFAQSAAILAREINRVATATTDSQRGDAIGDLVAGAVKVKIAAENSEKLDSAKLAAEAQELFAFRRADLQSGGGSGASGTTSAVSSPLLPAIFGMAFENGSITRSVSGSTVTLKVSPAGLFCANEGDGKAVAARDPEACKTFWRRVGVTAAFDTSRGAKDESLSTFSAAERQFAELAVRAELFNKRQPGSYQQFLNKAQAFVDGQGEFAAKTSAWTLKATAALDVLTKDANWGAQTVEERRKRVAAALDGLIKELSDASVPSRASWLAALKAQQRADFNRTVVTAEYTYQKPDLTVEPIGDPPIVPAGGRPPNVHTVRLIVAKGIGDRNIDFTFNQSVSWFSEVRDGMPGLLRDIRSGVEAKFKMREIENYGVPTLSFAGLYVYLNQEPLGLGLTAFNGAEITERGHIWLFQSKLEFPTANNAIRIPISISASNRTELINEPDVRGQIGFTFNLDAMFGEKKK